MITKENQGAIRINDLPLFPWLRLVAVIILVIQPIYFALVPAWNPVVAYQRKQVLQAKGIDRGSVARYIGDILNVEKKRI
ncbi:hypothetical protein [uncultured Desulfosarcina sp.]|uniref:hypothetical protein n=1 Tax=uncultured Desulfosarcina sp. TaxID=218289 RepID=UPI0029C8FD00|nr:hypothetical protein [uncultured Desulfosarcina sp.]